MANEEKIQNEVNAIITHIKAKGWKLTRTTKKAFAEAEALGLTPYLGVYARADVKGAEIVNAVIAAAKDAGGKVTTSSSWTGYGDADVTTTVTEPSALYLALNEVDEVETETIETDSGNVEIVKTNDIYKVSSPYETQDANSIEEAREIAQEMVEVLNEGWENS